jgi:hypothetical protein
MRNKKTIEAMVWAMDEIERENGSGGELFLEFLRNIILSPKL